jgi:hypothetical protein
MSWLLGLVILAPCDMFAPKEDDKSDDARSKSAKQAESAAPTAQNRVASDAPISEETSGPVPTTQEWDAVGEVTVKGSSALSCETKMVRDWFRASCRGKNDTGGVPTTVKVLSGRKPQTFQHAGGGVTSMVTLFTEGTHLEAVFSWTDKSHKLVLDWPRGAPKPQILGVFEGAKSPLDKPTSFVGDPKLIEAACNCERKFGEKNACFAPSEDCARTYSDCTMYMKCLSGDNTALPKCLPGHVLFSIAVCGKVCKTNADCPAGQECTLAFVPQKPNTKLCLFP